MRPVFRRVRIVPLLLSVLLWAVVFACYWARPDRGAAVTIIPPLLWAIPGLGLAVLGVGRARLIAVLLWLVLLWSFAEPISLVRGLRGPGTGSDLARRQGRTLRVVTVNTAGSVQALEQAAIYHPDVVLAQEPPTAGAVARVSHLLFGPQGAVVNGTDCDILYRGRSPRAGRWPATPRARVRLGSGEEIAVFGTHLNSTRPSFRLWRRDRWHRLAEDRRGRREELREVVDVVEAVPEGVPTILAGDFNAPAGDAIFWLLQPRLRDAFAEAGRGWASTWPSHLPLVRIDQVWVSQEWRVVSVRAYPAEPSDHRLVVCDLERIAGER